MHKEFCQSLEKDQDQIDQNHIKSILIGICNDPVDLGPFLKINVFIFSFFTEHRPKLSHNMFLKQQYLKSSKLERSCKIIYYIY
jgi:hypothetical protein